MRVGERGEFSAGEGERALWEYANNDAGGMTGLGGCCEWKDQSWEMAGWSHIIVGLPGKL